MSSPFAHRFNTNYIPSDSEIVAIRSLVREGETTMNAIERRTEELKQELIELGERWEAQKKQVDEHKALLSPIKRIPVDILTSIFLAVLEKRYDGPIISPRHPAVVISHVCTYWRNLALSTKLFWCHLSIDIPPYIPFASFNSRWSAKIAKLVEMAQVWISRSGGCQLRIELTDQASPGLESMEHGLDGLFSEGTNFDKLVHTLISSSSRWKKLKLDLIIPPTQLPRFPTLRLLALPPQSAPMLTDVTLCCTLEVPQQHNPDPISQILMAGPNILSTPTLRSLFIARGTLSYDIMRTAVIWSNLEHLTFDGYPSESPLRFDVLAALALFKKCPNLVTCYIALDNSELIPTIRTTPISLRRLREIAFMSYQSHLPKGFAQSLILPSLRKFRVITGYRGCTSRNHHDSGLVEFCERFGPSLEDVTFCYQDLTQSALLRCLQCLPKVTSLELISLNGNRVVGGSAKLNRDIILQLTPQCNAEGACAKKLPLCPRIQIFRFNAPREELAEEVFLDFVAARQREVGVTIDKGTQVAHLREVHCSGYPFCGDGPVEGLRRRGIDVDAIDFPLKDYYYRDSSIHNTGSV